MKTNYSTPFMKVIFLMTVLILTGVSCTKKEPVKKPIDEKEEIVPAPSMVLALPGTDKIYHAAFPEVGGTEDKVTKTKIDLFENLVDKEIAWVYFSNNFYKRIKFPLEEVNTIKAKGKVPFIRMMPRTDFRANEADPTYGMEHFISGRFDNDIKNWAKKAREYKDPLLVEFGTEVNGNWFPWNGEYNGAGATTYGNKSLHDGPERFRDAYRRIIDICNKEGAHNITWFFHVNAYSWPVNSWNKMKNYYPGDDYIDWIGVSVYGPQEKESRWLEFESILDDTWTEISSISKSNKPIAILEWGVIDYPEVGNKAKWITNAIDCMTNDGKYANKISAISYWHSTFGKTNLKIDSSPESLQAYKDGVSSDQFISKLTFKK